MVTQMLVTEIYMEVLILEIKIMVEETIKKYYLKNSIMVLLKAEFCCTLKSKKTLCYILT